MFWALQLALAEPAKSVPCWIQSWPFGRENRMHCIECLNIFGHVGVRHSTIEFPRVPAHDLDFAEIQGRSSCLVVFVPFV